MKASPKRRPEPKRRKPAAKPSAPPVAAGAKTPACGPAPQRPARGLNLVLDPLSVVLLDTELR